MQVSITCFRHFLAYVSIIYTELTSNEEHSYEGNKGRRGLEFNETTLSNVRN